MGSKKHKKESKKKKHRSRSRSPLEGEEREVRERKRHRKHKDRKKDRSPDVEEVPVDSHLVRERSDSLERDLRERDREYERAVEQERERDRERRAQRERERDQAYDEFANSEDRSRSRSVEQSGGAAGGGAQESLSIEETNRLRAKLGLKPLQLTETAVEGADDDKLKDDLGEFYHRPAANLAEQKKTEKIRERLEERKERRKLEHKLQSTAQLLAEDSGDEDAAAWVTKSRQLHTQKQQAAKRAAMLDELDQEFGVSALVEEEVQNEREAAYTADHLRGLRVAHHLDTLGEERETILTLADKDVLADDYEDVLVNVNMVDDEKYKKNQLERKKALSGYRAYDDEAELEAAGLGARPVLAKYDDEIDKNRAEKEKGFTIGDDSAQHRARVREMMRRERLEGGVNKRLESLAMPALQLATEYLDTADLKFKKPKKKGKMRKKAKQEPIDVDDYDQGNAPLDTDDTEVKPGAVPSLMMDDEEVEPDGELQTALARARRLRQARNQPAIPKVEEILERVKKEEPEDLDSEEAGSSGMVLDATAEFCRTLGDIPTYGLAGNRDSKVELMELEREDGDMEVEAEGGASGAWSRVDVGSEKPPDLAAGSSVGLDAEPALGAGVAGALRLALSKGYLERQGANPPPRASLHHLLAAKHYSIEDKTHGEEEKGGRRERGSYSHGPVTEFREKTGFRPNVKLEYADDEGRPLPPKEAFRYLSHKFHGKGPGKNKQEKRIKKAIQEGLMKKMSSTDTPLGTLQMLQEKQRETHSPYIVLSGSKRDTPH